MVRGYVWVIWIGLLAGIGGCLTPHGSGRIDGVSPSALPPELPAQRVAGSEKAPVRRVSLPLPRGLDEPLVWKHAPTQATPVGYWPGPCGRGSARRVILTGIGPGDELTALVHGRTAEGAFRGPTASVAVVDQRYDSSLPWETNELVLASDAGELAIRVGLKRKEGINWWQWVRLEVLDEGPVCRTVRARGAAPVHLERHESAEARAGIRGGYPWLHKHNHVRCEVVARCYANGAIELNVRHVNGRFFTEGGVLDDAVPVIGFRSRGGDWPERAELVTGRRRWHWDGASLDTSSAAHLVSAEHPGLAWRDADVCVYQPYAGVEARAGNPAEARTGDSFIVRAAQKQIPKGMGRTVRMVAALGGVEPDVAVYLLPDWWYGVSEDLCAAPLLPVRDETYATVEKAMAYYREQHHAGCFDDGAVLRHGPGMREPGWEGEAPHAQLLGAYLGGAAVDYDLTLRSAYYMADVGVDKTLFAVRMHGYEPPAQSLPMQRVLGIAAAYLETGDPYLLEVAESVAQTAYWWDRHNWPRRSFGRDAAYIRGLVYLYRYRGDAHYLDQAQEALHRLVSVQLPDGSFADQGDTTGIHAVMNLVVKPWMGCIATEAMVDFLACREDPVIEASALRFCQWLLTCRVGEQGRRHWRYQVSYAGGTTEYKLDGTPVPLPERDWHEEYLAKLLTWASLRTGDPAFYAAWHEAYQWTGGKPSLWDHGANKQVSNLPWQRMHLWQARLSSDGLRVFPRTDLAPDLDSGVVSGPGGRIAVQALTRRVTGTR